MTDRTYMQIDILECPHANASKVLQILSSYGFADESDGVLRLGPNNRYTVEEAPMGMLAYELAHELLGLCSFSGWENPTYKHPGTLVSSVIDGPQSELVTRQCLADGEPFITAADVLALDPDGTLGMLLHTNHQELLDLLYEKVKHEPDEIAIPHTADGEVAR